MSYRQPKLFSALSIIVVLSMVFSTLILPVGVLSATGQPSNDLLGMFGNQGQSLEEPASFSMVEPPHLFANRPTEPGSILPTPLRQTGNINPLQQLPNNALEIAFPHDSTDLIPSDPLTTLNALAYDDYESGFLDDLSVVGTSGIASISSFAQPVLTMNDIVVATSSGAANTISSLIGTIPLVNGQLITPAQGGRIISPNREVQIRFAPKAVSVNALGYYQDIIPLYVPPSLKAADVAFELSVQEASNNQPISYFPSKVIQYSVFDPEFNAWRTYYDVTPRVKVTIRYTHSQVVGLEENSLQLYKLNQTTHAWILVPAIININRNTVQAYLEYSGRYALLARPEANTLTPLSLGAGQNMTTTDFLVVLDPDHGGSDPGGTVTSPPEFAAAEKDYNLQIAQLVRSQLEACGLQVVMVREGDDSVPAATRISIIENSNPDAAITLAFDILEHEMNWLASGTAAWVDISKPIQSVFGNQVTSRVNEYTGLTNRGIKNGSHIMVVMGVSGDITFTHAELAFMDNYNDRTIIDDPDGMASIGNGVVAAILDMLGGMDICQAGFELPGPLSEADRLRLRNLAYRNWDRYRGDPVSQATGNHVQQFTDLYVPGVGGFDFALQRTYNSLDDRDGTFGFGWSSLLDMSLRFASDGSVDVRYADGSGLYFEANGSGFTAGQEGVFDTLSRSGPDYVLATPDQFFYWFDAQGRLIEVHDRYDNAITLDRDGSGRVNSITDSAGRTYDLTYDANHIASITDALGRTWGYGYDGDGNLTAVTDPNSGSYEFGYDGNHHLTTLTDPAGILYLNNIYDSEGRVIEQTDASGSQDFFNYDTANQSTFTDNLGNVTQNTYDDLFRVTTTTDALGNSESFVYDDEYNVVSYADKRGHTWTYTYDDRSNMLTETDPLGFTTSYTYNENNDVTSVTDLGGPSNSPRMTSYAYDPAGNLVLITRPDGTTIAATYDAFGQMLTYTDPNGGVTSYSYDSQGNLTSVTNPLSQITTYTYDAAGRQTSITDANGHSAHFTYDGNDNILTITDPKGQLTLFTYDDNDNLTQMVDRRGGVTTYQYDENLKLIAETDPEGHTTSYDYDAMYNRVSMIDDLGNETLYRYDVLYQLTEVENALGAVTAFAYDENGNVISVTDPLLNISSFTYDELNRLEQVTDPLNGVTMYVYDAVGRRTSETNPRGAVTEYEYDLLDRLVLVRDALGGEWLTGYDANGNVTSQTDANDHATTMTYDTADRLLSQIDPGSHTTNFTYDPVGNLLTVTDALGGITSYTYDANDNLATITDALTGLTSFSYDAEDTLIVVTDANGHTTQFSYDLDGLLEMLTEAGGQETNYEYDDGHNLVTLTNAKGNSWTYTYDALNRRTSETDPLGHTTDYAYDLLNRLTHLTDANSVTTRYDYDALDRLAAVVQNEVVGDPGDNETNVTTHYSYDTVGNLTSITDANGETTTFTYDLLNRLTQETNAINNVWQYGYDAVGNLTARLDAKNQLTTYTYDEDDLLATVAYPDSTGVQYGYDAAHNQTSMTDWLGVTLNTYDALNRLTSSTNHVGQAVSYIYDAVGNRTSMTYPDGSVVTFEYDETNFQKRVLDPDGNAFDVIRDATHNIVEIEYPNTTTATYTFDAAERLISVYNLEDNGDVISSFDYTLDAVGNRTRTEGEYAWRQPAGLDYDYAYDPLYRLVRSEDNEGRYTEYGFDAVGNRVQQVTNYDPNLNREVDVVTTTNTFNGANQLLTSVRDIAPRSNPQPDRLRQVGQLLRAFIHEVEAQDGKHITPSAAGALLADANDLLTALEGNPPPETAAITAALTDLENDVVAAGNAGQINNAGIVNSLLAKLQRGHQANQEQGGEVFVTFYTYDANGNRTQMLTPDDDTGNDADWLRTDYAYDFENRMVNVQHFRDPNGYAAWHVQDETVLTFDGYGRLFRRLHDQHIGGGGQSWRDYVYDGLDPIAEYLEPSPRYVNYYRGLGRILSMDDGEGLGQGSLYYYHYDGLGSVSAMTKHIGQSAHTYRYHDYGTILDNNDHAADSSNFTNPHNHYTYTGQEWDEYNELFHFYAREYDPQTGTWLQQDRYRGLIESSDSLHRYAYVTNNPLVYTDYYGYFLQAVVGVVGGAVIGAAVNVGSQIVKDVARGEFSGWRTYGTEALAGAVGGAVTGAVCLATAGVGCAIGGGALGGAAEQITRNLIDGNPNTSWHDGVVGATIAGGIGGAIGSFASARLVQFPGSPVPRRFSQTWFFGPVAPNGRPATNVVTALFGTRAIRGYTRDLVSNIFQEFFSPAENLINRGTDYLVNLLRERFYQYGLNGCRCAPPPDWERLKRMSPQEILDYIKGLPYQSGPDNRKFAY